MSSTRPCIIKVDKKSVQAIFHRFCEHAYVVGPSPMVGGAPGGQISIPLAIVEYEDGTVHYVDPTQVTFTDHMKTVVSSDTEKVKLFVKHYRRMMDTVHVKYIKRQILSVCVKHLESRHFLGHATVVYMKSN